MSHTNLTALPAQLPAGTTVKYTRAHADFPADQGWGLTLYLAGVKLASFAGTPTGASFAFTLDAATTATLAAGLYHWEERASKAGEEYIADSGEVEVLANIKAAEAGDFQDQDEKDLAAIEAVLHGRITADVQSYQIHGRAVVKIPVLELEKLRAGIKARVESKRRGGKLGPTLRMSFTGAESET